MPSNDLYVVLGASGGVGSAVVRELAAQGLRTRAVNRRGDAGVPDGVERLAADVATTAGAAAAAAGAAVVIHCAQPEYTRWPQEFGPMNDAVVDGAAAAGAKLVFADNLYMYGPPDTWAGGAITEATPEAATTRKGAVRADLSRRLLDAHRTGRLRVTMGRAGDYFGPRGVDTAVGDAFFGPLLKGKAVSWPGDPDVPRTFHYLPDVARGLVTLATDDAADGRAWILPAAPPLTARRFATLAGHAAGRPAKVRPAPKPLVRALGLVIPPLREVPDIWYQFDRPFVASDAAFQAAFGPQPATPPDEALAATVAWFRDHEQAKTTTKATTKAATR